ncbi:MAG: metalloregulator ArsR/SmtB family transcription factor [Panacagrimonas sp.]
MDLSTEACRLLADASRVRLLLLLEAQALSAAELTEITGLAQSRVSTHLARLKRAGLVHDERTSGAALYSSKTEDEAAAAGAIWNLLRPRLDDPQARLDREMAGELVRRRQQTQTWAESVAGRMELYYSPGRSWEATSRALMTLLSLGDVLDLASGDGVFAELIAAQARSVTCVDVSAAVIGAARKRLAGFPNVAFHQGDMHRLPFADQSFDHVFAMHALSYSADPAGLLREAARLLRPRGRLVVAALRRHQHAETQRAYDHINLGLEVRELNGLLEAAGLVVESCRVTSRETRPPYFEVISAAARR